MVTTARRAFLLVALLVAAGGARAALECEATVDRTSVARGGSVVLTVGATGDFTRTPQLPAPRIPGVAVSSAGTSRSFSFGGGSAQAVVSAVYYLQVERDDDFTIPALTVEVAGERCTTAPIAIDVTAAAAMPPPDHTGNRTSRPQSPSPPAARGGLAAGGPGDEIFLSLTADRLQAWVGEQIVLSFRYYRRVNPWGNPSYDAPGSEGFWRVDLPPERNYREVVAGLTYQVTEIRYALFATRAGDLEIGPARLTFADDPFSRLMGRPRGGRVLATAPLKIRVRELPSPRPAGFSGVVASDLKLTAAVDRDSVPRGEPVELTVNLVADGFLKGFTGVPVPAAPGVRVHDATDDLREDVAGPRYRATMCQAKVLVPTQEGPVVLPRITLAYFDAARGAYATATADPGRLVVTAGGAAALAHEPSGAAQEEILRLGTDLAFVHAVTGPLARAGRPLCERLWWWAAALAPWGLLWSWRRHLRHRDAERGDPVAARRRRAFGRARRALGNVAHGRGGEDAPAAIAAAIAGYVADRLGRSPAGLTGAEVRAHAAACGESPAGERLVEMLEACDRARFGGGAPVGDPAALAAEAQSLLARLEAAASPSPRTPRTGPALVVLLAATLAAGAAARVQESTPARAADPARLVAEGSEAYTRGDVATARARYEAALAGGVDDAVVHYNLATAHAREGHLGRAVAGYLRALRRAPRDRDAAANLAWVRAQTRDLELGGRRLPPVIAQLDAAARRLSLDEWCLVTLLALWTTAALVATAWWRGGAGDRGRRILIAAGVVLVVAAAVTLQRWHAERVREQAVVVAEEVEVRSGPATSFPVVFRIHDGLTLTIRGEREGWARVGLGGDWVGWVPQETLERVRRAPPGDQGR